MVEKKETEHKNDIEPNQERRINLDNRWGEDRRKEPSDGFTYITSVGWIDRRERLRRKDDPNDF